MTLPEFFVQLCSRFAAAPDCTAQSMPQTADAARESALKRFLPPGPRPLPCRRDVQRGRRLRLFVYGLPWAYHGQVVEYVERRARELLHVNCAYLREDTCPNTGFSHLENLRSHCTDVPIFSKLLQVATLVGEPERADVFLVPFLLGCNAMLGWGHGMSRVNGPAHHAFFGSFDKFARDSLPHFARWPHRHLFLFPLDSMFMPKWLGGSMLAHTGAGYRNKSRLDITIPYLASLPRELVRAQPDAGARSTRVFLMASPSRNKVRSEVARQLREASGAGAGRGRAGSRGGLVRRVPPRSPLAAAVLLPTPHLYPVPADRRSRLARTHLLCLTRT